MLEPFVSVLVPVRNEERYIERCLYSIARQSYPRARFEVLVVDGMSDDRTRETLARFVAESTLDVRLLDNPRRTAAAGMNIGLGEARGTIIVRLDGHATMAPDYLRRCIDALYDTGADCVGGVIRSEGDSYAGRAIALAMSSRFGVGGAAFRVGGAGVADTVAFGAYRRDVFERLGGFSEDIVGGEDDEFNYRLRDAGGLILLIPGINSTYTVRGGLSGLWRQYFTYGRAKPEVLRRHPGQLQPRQLAPALFVGALAVTAALARNGRRGPLAALLTAYGASVAVASVAASRRSGVRGSVSVLPMMPAAFAVLHLSYGAGFLAGAFDVLRRAAARDSAGVEENAGAR